MDIGQSATVSLSSEGRQSRVPGTLGAITLLLPKNSLADLALASSVLVGHMLVDNDSNINNNNNPEQNEGKLQLRLNIPAFDFSLPLSSAFCRLSRQV